MKALFFIIVLTGLLQTAKADVQLTNCILKATTTGGFTEFEFREDGTLVSYGYVKDGTLSGPSFTKQEVFEPRFRVEFLTWKLEGKKLTLMRGSDKMVSDILEDKEYVYFNELAWKRVTKPEFFERLFNETGKKFVEQEN